MITQNDIFGNTPKVVERGEAGKQVLPQVTSIIASLSGGIDGFAACIFALAEVAAAGVDLTTIPVILWHAAMPKMDWVDEETGQDYTDETLGYQLDAIRHIYKVGQRSSWQAVYQLTGGTTPTGFPSAEMQTLHCVRNGDTYYGTRNDEAPSVMTNLLELTDVYRKGNPPTSGMRYCTAYGKSAGFDWWLVRNKSLLGPCPLVIRGERRAESAQRSKRLEEWSWALDTVRWNAAVWLPCIDWKFHRAAQLVLDAAGTDAIHPCYFWQSELSAEDTLTAMVDPLNDERGRPRCSCVLCIFANMKHIMMAQSKVPHLVDPHLNRMRTYEGKWKKSWKQSQWMPPPTIPASTSTSRPILKEKASAAG